MSFAQPRGRPDRPSSPFAFPDESTLGGSVRPAGARSAVRRGSPSSTHGSALGTGFLGVAVAIVAALQSMIGLGLFLARASEYPVLLPAIAAWMLLLVTFLALIITISSTGERLPDWLYAVFLAALAAVVALDFLAIAPFEDVGRWATASVSAGFVLLVVVTLRAPWEVLAAALALGAAFIIIIALTTPLTPLTIPSQLVTVALAVAPGITGVLLVAGFERMLKRELDRVLVQSTVTVPRLAVGMLASEELARLDLAAEELLDAVAEGAIPLPLRPKVASQASGLATELRLHLLEGRRETWLVHAVTESEQLGKRVTVSDPATLAGLLDDVQRDALLAALWMFGADPLGSLPAESVTVALGPLTSAMVDGHGRTLVPVVIEVTGLKRNRVDPGVWEALDNVGRYSDTTAHGVVRIEIDCPVENPVDAARPS